MAFAFSTTPGVGVGTISIAKNGTAVTGVGTNFTSPSLVNQIILVNGFNSRVTAVASATSMTINRAPSYEITGEAFSFVTAATNINQTGADTDPSGLSALIGVNTYRVGTQAVYDLGVMRLALTGAAAVFSYNANLHCIVWNNQITAPELTVGSGRTLTITGARTDGTYTASFYPRALAMPRVLPAGDSTFLPAHRSVLNSGTLNFSGVWIDANQVQEIGATANFTDIKWSTTNQQANYRMNSGNININGMDLLNMPLTLIAQAGSLNGLRFFNSGYTPVSLPARTPTNPRIYTDWNFLGALPLMNNFSGNANYVEFVNFGDWAGFKLATNSAVNMAARFTKAVSVSVLDSVGVGITGAIVYRLDTNNGSRVTYTADEHFIQTTASGAASGKILALIGRLPAGAANNSTQYTAFMDCRNAANDQTGNDVLRYVSYEHLLNNRAINTKGINTLTVEQTLFDDPNITLDKAGAIAKLASSFTVDTVGKVVTVTANSTFDDIYDALKAHKATANAVNLATPTLDALIVTPNGTQLNGFTGWTLSVNNGVVLNQGTKFDSVAFTTVNLNTSGLITGLYSSGGVSNKILEINGVTNGSSLYVGNNATGITTLYQDDTDQATYRVYFAPGTTPAQLVARELYPFQRSAQVVTLVDGLNVVNLVDIPDVGITEETLATVLAYTEIEIPSKFYDRTAAFRLTEQGIKLGQMVTRSGTALEIGNFSHLINKDATLVYSVTGSVITTKSTAYAGDDRYQTEIANPPATIEANTTEVLTINLEDGNGNSQITIAGGRGTYEIWKITSATASADYEAGTKVGDFTTANNKYRFIGDTAPGFDYLTVDLTTTVKDRYPAVKGVYVHSLYSGAEIQLAQAPEVIENGIKLDVIKVELAEIKAKTDNLPADPAAVGDAMTLTSAYDAAKTAATQESVDEVKAKTDGLTFTVPDKLDVNIKYVNDIEVKGTGEDNDPWNPV
jgi:hypothetical protein